MQILDSMLFMSCGRLTLLLGQAAFAMSVVTAVATDWSHWTHDPSALQAARAQLGQQLSGIAAQ